MAEKPAQTQTAQNEQQCVDSTRPVVGDDSTKRTADDNTGKVHWPTAKGVFFGIAGFCTVAGLFYAGVHWLEDRIDKAVEHKLSDQVILRKIAAEARPVLVFNGLGAIVSDGGAVQFVKELKITATATSVGTTNLPAIVHIEFTKFLASAPILSPLSENLCLLYSERGVGLSWDCHIEWNGTFGGLDAEKHLFRLELMP